MEGHVFANFLADEDLKPPFMALVVSGGHTALLKVTGYNSFELLGQTRDDAAGEAFDKIARVMGLPYPGGPEIERLAMGGNDEAMHFPLAKLDKPYEFSFSGLKSGPTWRKFRVAPTFSSAQQAVPHPSLPIWSRTEQR